MSVGIFVLTINCFHSANNLCLKVFSFNLNSQTNSKKKHSTTIASKKHDKKVIKKKVAKNTSYKNKHKKV